MNYPEYTDPSEWVGTEEYEELRSEREAKRPLTGALFTCVLYSFTYVNYL